MQAGRRGDEERKTHGTNSGLMAFRGFTSAVLSRRCPLPLYHLASLQCTAQHVTDFKDGRNAGQRESRYRARPQVDLVKQMIRVLSSILAGWYFPSLPCAQPHAPPAYHYQASGPYCITDGADRRERRQPACILELQLSERRGREGESKRERKCNFSLSRW